jgi:NAD(P)-dependent dehydrogenase (short-subunit alcohol dehydrogenase family)
LVVRDRGRGERARDEVLRRLGAAADLRVALCDLAELESVARLAADLAEREPDLAVLVNNAGVLAQRRERSASGAELTFATNVLGPFALTELLLPALRAGTPGRVVTVSSGGMYTARLDGADLQLDHRTFHGPRFYAHTKRAEVVLNELWSAREGAAGVRFAAMHPGWADTAGLQRSLPRFHRLVRPLLRDARQGADTIVWLATAPAAEVPGGRFWHDRRPRPTHRLPRTHESAEDRRALWRESQRLATP